MNRSLNDRIGERAYEIYLRRGGTHGSDFDDWVAAEKEIIAEDTASKQAKAPVKPEPVKVAGVKKESPKAVPAPAPAQTKAASKPANSKKK